jgi:ATP-dependent RNA helicase DeaD
MGREGVAYTFVCPHEGPELTRIEERISRLLKRDELEDFEASAWKFGTPVGYSRSKGMAASPQADGEGTTLPTPPAPPTTLMKRKPKKYRRAL